MMSIRASEELLAECIESIQQLIRIPSVKEAPTESAPFGEPIGQSLDFILNLAKKLGLHTRNLDGYIGIVEMGEGAEELGILVHVDVVPAGDESKWRFPPFSGTIADGSIWGRGTLDDKGPAVAVLYAMKLLNDLSLSWNKRIRLIIGTDEESTWEDIDYYKQVEALPTMAFTPDGCFPVTNSEKGILTLRYEKQITDSTIVSDVKAGERSNVTPGLATATLEMDYDTFIKDNTIKNSAVSVKKAKNGKCVITATGKEGHSSLPVQEENAIHLLLKALKNFLREKDSFLEVIDFYEGYLEATNGSGHGCKLSDDTSGELTLATSILNFSNLNVELISNIRYPSSYKKADIINNCTDKLIASTFDWSILEHKDPVYIPEDTPFIQELLFIYNNYFDSNEKAQSIAGGTYARAFPNTVAFGALIPGKPLNAHEVDEHVELEIIHDWINIYAQTIYTLAAKQEG